MDLNNMTALVCTFARAYHYKNNKYRIFSDNLAQEILTEEEYKLISNSLVQGISFFNQSSLKIDDPLRWIVDNKISPSVLLRSSFCEHALSNRVRFNCEQYIILASGYDTFAYRNKFKNLKVYEIDKPAIILDKIKRVKNLKIDALVEYLKCDFNNEDLENVVLNSTFNNDKEAFVSLLGISYYLSKEEFSNLLSKLSNIICDNSSIVFDYQNNVYSIEATQNKKLAYSAKEEMKSKYTYDEIEEMLSNNGFLIYEHMNEEDMNITYLDKYNLLNPRHKINAPKSVSYVLAVKSNRLH